MASHFINHTEYRKFSLFIPIFEKENQRYLLLTKRALHLRKQPGDISFPGGTIEENETPLQAAIRETCEELLIDQAQIHHISQEYIYITPFNHLFSIYLGVIKDYQLSYSVNEVEALVLIPFNQLSMLSPKIYSRKVISQLTDDFPYHLINQDKNYPFLIGNYPIYFFEFDSHVIWGLTASILYYLKQTILNY